MSTTAEKTTEHLGETRGSQDHVHDLVQTMSRCLSGLWRYDQYINNAEGKPELQKFWQKFKEQEQESVKRMKRLLAAELQKECESC
jgi:hypothetical protein